MLIGLLALYDCGFGIDMYLFYKEIFFVCTLCVW